jgi:hypothetical protein
MLTQPAESRGLSRGRGGVSVFATKAEIGGAGIGCRPRPGGGRRSAAICAPPPAVLLGSTVGPAEPALNQRAGHERIILLASHTVSGPYRMPTQRGGTSQRHLRRLLLNALRSTSLIVFGRLLGIGLAQVSPAGYAAPAKSKPELHPKRGSFATQAAKNLLTKLIIEPPKPVHEGIAQPDIIKQWQSLSHLLAPQRPKCLIANANGRRFEAGPLGLRPVCKSRLVAPSHGSRRLAGV